MSISAFSNFLTLVLQNNPSAISQKLVEKGYLENQIDHPEDLRLILMELAEEAKDGGKKILLEVLNVPLNEHGENVQELIELYTSKANISLLTTFLQTPNQETPKTNLREGRIYFEWDADKWLKVLGFSVLALAGIFFLKKLFSSE